jgi:hypothetical protein
VGILLGRRLLFPALRIDISYMPSHEKRFRHLRPIRCPTSQETKSGVRVRYPQALASFFNSLGSQPL